MQKPRFLPAASSAHRDYQRQRQMTLGDLLLENRIILLQGEIHDGNANELVMAGEDGYATYLGDLEADQLTEIPIAGPLA